ncbi:YggS family pyridoxal phosphate-dependent enzyme [Marinomonas sp. M1K-6]|uniref:Pyridoxal phosphate homeostasis protein n=1 Tax=Marinomonas profundi TaxID=2726122 RepID=A0A847R874_9GAMM|nr:YggS family pyridoxal phosphate-dependent enzyme [Marinomonas profundi]NLQ17367.1 YggS family pyridoxal phosphate-dependent enzyme [Marinomonas profundi]UDV01893.1 YggS family pyridoxal phosphate-dependent enzyme [Marinomonas profundi]
MSADITQDESVDIKANLAQVSRQIASLIQQHQRVTDSVRLLAVSKTKPLAALEAAYHAGQRAFGENYVQEAVDKCQALAHLSGIEWHFIGPIQSNKSRLIAETMHWVHSVDREKIALRLNDQRPVGLPPLNVCIQVNISGEESKSGVALSQLDAMVTFIARLPNLRLRGLMAIPAPQANHMAQCAVYAPLQQAFIELSKSDSMIDTLSIGMSGDLSAAIQSGSTMVRVGTAIFGERDYSAKA